MITVSTSIASALAGLTAVQLTLVITLALIGGIAVAVAVELSRHRAARIAAADARRAARIAEDEDFRQTVAQVAPGSALHRELYGTDPGSAPTVHIPVIRPVEPEWPSNVVFLVEDEHTGAVTAYGDRVAETLVTDGPPSPGPDPADVVEQVAPGPGSLTDLAGVHFDTHDCRTPTEQHHLDTVYEQAYEEHDAWLFAEMFRAFDDAMHAARTDFAVGTRKADRWLHLHHPAGDIRPCPRCSEAMEELTAEYRQIVGGYDTGQLDIRAELDAMLAADAVTAATAGHAG